MPNILLHKRGRKVNIVLECEEDGGEGRAQQLFDTMSHMGELIILNKS